MLDQAGGHWGNVLEFLFFDIGFGNGDSHGIGQEQIEFLARFAKDKAGELLSVFGDDQRGFEDWRDHATGCENRFDEVRDGESCRRF